MECKDVGHGYMIKGRSLTYIDTSWTWTKNIAIITGLLLSASYALPIFQGMIGNPTPVIVPGTDPASSVSQTAQAASVLALLSPMLRQLFYLAAPALVIAFVFEALRNAGLLTAKDYEFIYVSLEGEARAAMCTEGEAESAAALQTVSGWRGADRQEMKIAEQAIGKVKPELILIMGPAKEAGERD